MQTEAGQGLGAIVRRKELERQSGDGLFFWGVGNAPSTLTRPLARTGVPIPVIFSVMKTAPKKADVAPDGIVAWNSYIDRDGVEREIPDHVLVISRGSTGGGPKKVHYALMCKSSSPLAIDDTIPFNHRGYRNAGVSGGTIGASQVTALLEPSLSIDVSPADYRQNMIAELTGSYWVRLTRPNPVRPEHATIDVYSLDDYRRTVAQCRNVSQVRLPEAHLLF